MIWLTWRLQRTELAILGGILALLIALLIKSQADVVLLAENAKCFGNGPVIRDSCLVSPGAIYRLVDLGLPWLNFLPLIAAILLALPIVQELESGTYRLAWTQGITRFRWIGVKLGLLSLCGVAFAGIFAFAFNWWKSPADTFDGRLGEDSYDFRGILPIAHTLFAIALVLVLGTLLRRPIPAAVIALVAYVGLRLPFMLWIRPHLIEPKTASGSLNQELASNWVLSRYWVNSAGQRITEEQAFRLCPPTPGSMLGEALNACFDRAGLVQTVEYHPDSRFWPLQLMESGIYLGAALALLAFAACYLLRRFE